MAARTCPICQVAAEPLVDGDGREFCRKCELQLPPPDLRPTAPPRSSRGEDDDDRPPVRTARARRDPDPEPRRVREDDRPRRRTPSGTVSGFTVSILLLVGGFVLMTFFFCGVIVIKTQFTSPSTGSSNPSWQQRNPWDPEPDPFGPGGRWKD
jgi:hypothetical protein